MADFAAVVTVLLIIVAIVGLLVAKRKGSVSTSSDVPYEPSVLLFSAAERSFLGVLDQAVGSEYRVFGKVRVADLTRLKSGLSNSARQIALNRVAGKHFDFVVCRASDLSVVCAVELNDKSHSSQRAQARDEFLTKVCEAIGLPLLTVQAKGAYSVQEIQNRFVSLISSHSLPEALSQH